MLNIGKIERLAGILDSTPKRLEKTLLEKESYYEVLILLDPSKPDKERQVLNVTGILRQFQELFLRRVLIPRLKPSTWSHGGVTRRSPRTNVEVHKDADFLLKADISNFYPSIDRCRLFRSLTRLGCSPTAARVCTQLCTYRHKLALGLCTSPILADQMLRTVDSRIAGFCKQHGLNYSRFVDDITVSGPFDFQRSGFAGSIQRILEKAGFAANPSKWEFGPVLDGVPITGIRVRPNGLDISKTMLESIESQMKLLRQLASGKTVAGPYTTRGQLMGRIHFVRWINDSRGNHLLRQARSIDWPQALRNAKEQQLVVAKKRLVAAASPDRGAVI